MAVPLPLEEWAKATLGLPAKYFIDPYLYGHKHLRDVTRADVIRVLEELVEQSA